jgi:2-polyprenyl-3-methyl-5-hydroxy-6-metoxy-1,4-benzoquinol methylase
MHVRNDHRLQGQDRVNAYFQTRVSKWKHMYNKACLRGEIYRARQAIVLEWIDRLCLEPQARLLEVGCGAGFLSIALAQRGFRVHAIDAVEPMIEQARLHAAMSACANQLFLELGDVNALSFENASFDLVVGVGVLPWLAKPVQALQEMARVTKPNGYVLLTTDNWLGLINLLDPVHNPMFTPLKRGLNSICNLTGLPYRIPIVTSQFCRDVDKTLAALNFEKVWSKTLGFGPCTLFNYEVIPETPGKWFHTYLQTLADRNVPGIRSLGKHYIVLAVKSG